MASAAQLLHPGQWLAQWRSQRAAKASTDMPLPIHEWSGAPAGAGGMPTRIAGFDQALVWVVVSLLALGLVMVYSASIALPDAPKFARYAPTHFVIRHAMSIGIAVVAALLAVQVPTAMPIDSACRMTKWVDA